MAESKAQRLRDSSEADLHQRMGEARLEVTTLRLKAKEGALEQPHRIRQLKHEIAQIFTLLRLRALDAAAAQPGSTRGMAGAPEAPQPGQAPAVSRRETKSPGQAGSDAS